MAPRDNFGAFLDESSQQAEATIAPVSSSQQQRLFDDFDQYPSVSQSVMVANDEQPLVASQSQATSFTPLAVDSPKHTDSARVKKKKKRKTIGF